MNRTRFWQALAPCAIVILGLFASAAEGLENADRPLPEALSRRSLTNFTYSCGLDGDLSFDLHNGMYKASRPYIQGHETTVTANLVQAAWGEVPGAGATDQAVAVVYTYNTGGTGHFYQLSLVGVCLQQPCELACAELGDRVQLLEIDITDDGKIVAKLVVHGENDLACCPTRHVTRTWTYTPENKNSGTLQQQ